MNVGTFSSHSFNVYTIFNNIFVLIFIFIEVFASHLLSYVYDFQKKDVTRPPSKNT